ncbi:hypothetical protein EUZ85_17315 [Hahella sp. KA22]|uniref:EscF/YscF/HrpA family type III secretion system needle major subunit n=1 Tax=Hahella sp. KA22 TaxID=1628392 RepID=UPI000FDDD1C6|nr:EscF/YscF/HrpA family type III secretion system needle major subunit [Hahella sp. KA22]AZZ92386.1 hypothetical protein ENC22_14740 [Hahella sp. KA22]QAY55760.1 hypothetical protein EUZ85_17315 [Hahella sp. KA22]
MAFNFDAINDAMGRQATLKEEELRSFANSMDPNNSTDLIKFQQKVQEWGLITNLQSTTIKSLKDTIASIVQKMQ